MDIELYNNFINNIETDILLLLNDFCISYLNILDENKNTILYGNEFMYLNTIININKTFNKANIIKNLDNENDYESIKNIISNKRIDSKNHLFVINNLNKKYESRLKKILDSENCKIILLCPCLSKLNDFIKSRCVCINCSFPFKKIQNYIYNKTNIKITNIKYSFLYTLLSINYNSELAIETFINNFISKKKVTITNIKEFCLKLYTMGIPKKLINAVIINKYKDNKSKIYDIIELLASVKHCDKDYYDYNVLESIFSSNLIF